MDAEIARTVPVTAALLLLMGYWIAVMLWFRVRARRRGSLAMADARVRSAGPEFNARLNLPLGPLLIALALPVALLFAFAALRG